MTKKSIKLLSALILSAGISGFSNFSDGGPATQALAQRSSPMHWEHDLRKSFEQARNSNKLVLVDVYTDWCHWCKELDRSVYSDAQVAAYLNNNFVCVKVNAEDPTLGNWVKVKYDVNGYPAILMLKDKETVVGRIGGYEPKQQFISHVQFFAQQAQQFR